jgi:Tfp pilus assembly protein PilF
MEKVAKLQKWQREQIIQKLQQNPENATLWKDLGALYLEDPDYGKAQDAVEKALEIKPEYADAWALLSKVHLGLKNTEQALETAKKAVQLQSSADTWVQLGTTYIEIGNYSEAENAIQKALSLDPKSSTAWDELAKICEHYGEPEKAAECRKKAGELRFNGLLGIMK